MSCTCLTECSGAHYSLLVSHLSPWRIYNDTKLPRPRPGRVRRAGDRRPLRRRAADAGGSTSLRQRPGAHPQRPRRQPALGHAATVRGDSGRAEEGRRDLRLGVGQPGHRHLGRGLRAARPQRPAGGPAVSLSRQPQRHHDGRGVPPRAARGDLRGHRHPVHAVEHPVPASRPTDRRSRSAGAHAHPPDDARPAELLADRAEGQRAHHRQHQPGARSAPPGLGDGLAGATGHPDALPADHRRGGHGARAACSRP